jgi:hypothetical protein
MLKRKWMPLFLDDCPTQIKNHPIYADRDWWCSEPLITDDGRYVLFRFDDGCSHLWRLNVTNWKMKEISYARN